MVCRVLCGVGRSGLELMDFVMVVELYLAKLCILVGRFGRSKM